MTSRVIEALRGDITKIKADVIVNAAHKTLLGGGGVDGAIHKAAGPELLRECQALGGCLTGQAKITQGHNLPARYVIHTVGPVWNGGKFMEKELLADCYRNALTLAVENTLKTIAFPSISTGAYRFPIEMAAPIAIGTVKAFCKERPGVLDRVLFVLFSETDLWVYNKLL